ncbi:RnfABCDGE type electron transport complex subunit D, partial [Patescibacteria group bacterium]|nr:RnfABCDGE type electron transport complex subunit D [Patescibacteria group bacterium]
PTNVESVYITALILALIITPPVSFHDTYYLLFILWASVWAMASKYIFAIGKKHIFNPAAFAVALTAFTINQSASWWVGTTIMLPYVLVGGLLITRKIKRFSLVIPFIITSLIGAVILHSHALIDIPKVAWNTLLTSPIFFFAFIMLTEPLTTPPTQRLRALYGGLVGGIFDPLIHLGPVFSTPELSLIIGNIFSYLVSPKEKLILRLKDKIKIAKDTYNFIFESDRNKFNFKAGQYLEWTLPHRKPDNRGNRRYFTIASAPEESEIKIGVKFYPKSSTFKNALLEMQKGDTVVASQLSGDFTLPKDLSKKICFIAGGIGVTPFESIVSSLLATKEKRDVVMFYANNSFEDISYMSTFDRAQTELGIKTIYALSSAEKIPEGWPGEKGFVTADMIKNKMPDWRERMYYISGPHAMVTAFEDTLKKMGIPSLHIKIDFFPGFV